MGFSFLDVLLQQLGNRAERAQRTLHTLDLAGQTSLAPQSQAALTSSSLERSEDDGSNTSPLAWIDNPSHLSGSPTQLVFGHNLPLVLSGIDAEPIAYSASQSNPSQSDTGRSSLTTPWDQQGVFHTASEPRFELLKNGRGGGGKKNTSDPTDPVDPGNTLQLFSDIGIEKWRGRYGVTQADILPWGVQAAWQSETGAPVNLDFSGATAWILDTGFSQQAAADFHINTGLARNFTSGDIDGDAFWNDNHGHGTHVAGTIGAEKGTPDDWGFSVEGVAPGVEIVPIKVLDDNGSGAFSWIYNGLDYAIDSIKALGQEASSVINLSLGVATAYVSDAWKALFSDLFTENTDITFVVAAGNESTEAEVGNYFSTFGELSHVYVSTAVDQSYELAGFSNYDALINNGNHDDTDYSTAGVDVWSTSLSGGATRMSGTSMSAPHLAGILLADSVAEAYTLNSLNPLNGADHLGGYEDAVAFLGDTSALVV
jgi:subtilisin family serine protease